MSDLRHIQELFELALELPEAQRRAFVESRTEDPETRREVLELLAYDARGLTHVNEAVGAAAQQIAGPAALPAGTLIGPWRVRRVLGQGGMGAVYEVERADGAYQQTAALKRIRSDSASPDGLRRFLEERDILARLNHPNIARLLDGGTDSGGQPYLVMEAVDGLPITEYCERNRLSLRQKLTLFLDVCKGVQSAHARLVIHRDLKPSNIHVTHDGQVKLLDFGIAKLVDPTRAGATLTGMLVLTPEYASPEQVSGSDVSTASDVYSLGAVLFELLTGAKAHALTSTSPAEIVRVVIESEVERPSAAAPGKDKAHLTGDLDTIVLAAMQKLPERRYASVDKLAEDIERYLTGRVVLARPDSFSYRAGKFLRRNWIPVSAAAVVAISLVAAVAVSTIQARRAQRRFDEVRALANTFLFDFHDKIRDLPGSTSAREMVVATARKYLDNLAAEAGDDTQLQLELAAAYDRLGEVLNGLGRHSLGRSGEALNCYRRAFEIRQDLGRAHPTEPAIQDALTDSYKRMGDAEKIGGTVKAAMEYWLEAARRARASNSTRQEFQVLLEIGLTANQLSNRGLSIESLKRAISLVDNNPRIWPDGPERARTAAQARLIRPLHQSGRVHEARDLTLEALATTRKMLTRYPESSFWLRQRLGLHIHLGDIYNARQDSLTVSPSESIQPYRDALILARQISKLEPSSILAAKDEVSVEYRLGALEVERGDLRALDRLESVSARQEALVRRDPLNTYGLQSAIGMYLAVGITAADHQLWARALHQLERAALITAEIKNGDSGRMFRSEELQLHTHLGLSALRLGRLDRSGAALTRCREVAGAIPLPAATALEVAELARCFHTSGEQAQSTGNTLAAREYFRQAINAWQAGIDRPNSDPQLKTKREESAAALAKLP